MFSLLRLLIRDNYCLAYISSSVVKFRLLILINFIRSPEINRIFLMSLLFAIIFQFLFKYIFADYSLIEVA